MRDLTFETCDRCGPTVKAAVLVWNIPVTTVAPATELPNFGFHGELTFCGHHAKKYALTFTAAGYQVYEPALYGSAAA